MEPVPPFIQGDSDFRRLLERLQGRAFAVSPPLEWDDVCLLGVFCPDVCETCLEIPLQYLQDTVPHIFGLKGAHVYVHALKENTLWLALRNVKIASDCVSDVSLAAYLLSPPEPNRGEDFRKFFLHNLIRDYLGEWYPFLHLEVAKSGTHEVLQRRVREDAHYVWRLAGEIMPRLEADNALCDLYRTTELPVASILADMERRGVGLDLARVKADGSGFTDEFGLLQSELADSCKKDINVFSEHDLRMVARDVCGEPVPREERFDDDFISDMGQTCPEMGMIYRLRRMHFLLDLFSWGKQGDGHVFPTWWLTRAATGRIQSTRPNLQGLPRECREYLSPGAGRVFIKADYSAFQLRLLAHLSGDTVLTELFRKGRDPHAETRDRLADRNIFCDRAQGKTINFLICYGGGGWALSRKLGLSLKEANRITRELKSVYPEAMEYLTGVAHDLSALPESERCVRSLHGRLRRFDTPGRLTGRQKRQARNAVVQMAEADVFKKAVIGLHRAFEREGLPVGMELLLHDGIYFACPNENATVTIAKEIIRREMERAAELSVPLKVDFE